MWCSPSKLQAYFPRLKWFTFVIFVVFIAAKDVWILAHCLRPYGYLTMLISTSFDFWRIFFLLAIIPFLIFLCKTMIWTTTHLYWIIFRYQLYVDKKQLKNEMHWNINNPIIDISLQRFKITQIEVMKVTMLYPSMLNL